METTTVSKEGNDKKALQLAKKWIKKEPMPSSLAAEFKRNGLKDLLDDVYIRTAELVKENENVTKAELEHLEQVEIAAILSCILENNK